MIHLSQRDILLSALTLGVVLLVLVLTLKHAGGKVPGVAQFVPARAVRDFNVTNSELNELFAAAVLGRVRTFTNPANPFYTTYFLPPPPPPPVRTRKVPLTYQGFFQATEGVKRAYVTVGTNLVIKSVGEKVIADFVVSDVALQTLAVQQGTNPPTLLPFRAAKEVEVPIE